MFATAVLAVQLAARGPRRYSGSMTSLSERLMRPEVKPRVIEGCCALIEREVGSKRGFGGAAVKAGFAVVTRVKPGFIRDVVTKLLPEFADSLQPFYDQSVAEVGEAAAPDAFVQHVSKQRTEAAEALLAVTDRKIGGARPGVRRAYEKLRPNARDNVEAAVPGLAETIREHLG
jgi:hypothetical protein